MEFHPSNTLSFPYPYQSREPNPDKPPQESLPSIPVPPELGLRMLSSDSAFSFQLGKRQSSLVPTLSDSCDMTPNFSRETGQKFFFGQEIWQKSDVPEQIDELELDEGCSIEGIGEIPIGRDTEQNIDLREKTEPIMVMDRFDISANMEKCGSRVKQIERHASFGLPTEVNDEKIYPNKANPQTNDQSYRVSLDTAGTSHDELGSLSSEKAQQSLRKHSDYARPSHSIWSSASYIDDHHNEIPHNVQPFPEETEIQEVQEAQEGVKNLHTVDNKASSIEETTTLINNIKDILINQADADLLVSQPAVLNDLINEVQKKKVRVRRVYIETIQDPALAHRDAKYIEKDEEQQFHKPSLKLDIAIEKIQPTERPQNSVDMAEIGLQMAKVKKQELASEFEKLKGMAKDLLKSENLEYDSPSEFEIWRKASKPIQNSNTTNISLSNGNEEYSGKLQGKREDWTEKRDSDLEESEDRLELGKNERFGREFSTEGNFLEKDEIKQRALENVLKGRTPELREEPIEASGSDKKSSAWMARLVTVGLIIVLVLVLWLQLSEE